MHTMRNQQAPRISADAKRQQAATANGHSSASASVRDDATLRPVTRRFLSEMSSLSYGEMDKLSPCRVCGSRPYLV